jgi:hypothetical protein
MEVRRAEAGGRGVPVRGGALRLRAGDRTVRLVWSRRADAPALSYERAVDAYKQEYRRRWERWMHGDAPGAATGRP